MNGFVHFCIFALLASATAEERGAKSLVNQFPFNARGHGEHHGHGGHHEDHHDHHHAEPTHGLALSLQESGRQGFGRQQQQQSFGRGGAASDVDTSFDAVAAAAASGQRCVDKVVMVKEIEYDDVVTCQHSYSEKCHTTYVTDYKPVQEEECNENFVKKCFIDYKQVANDEEIEECRTPLICEGEGPEVCRDEYTTTCLTTFHKHQVQDDVADCEIVHEKKCEDVTSGYTTEQKCTSWPKKVCKVSKKDATHYTPETDCKPVKTQLCGPSSCIPKPGKPECWKTTKTIVQEVPEETCNLEPQTECKHETKLVPQLKPTQECVDIPKEVCSRSRANPRTVEKPVVKKWCYIPTPESGLQQQTPFRG